MNKKIIIYILLIVLGITLIAYPFVSNYISLYKQASKISEYSENVKKIPEEKKKQELENAKTYNENLEHDTAVDLSLNKEEKNTNKTNILKIGETIGYISIPEIQVYLPIYQGINKEILNSGVGHIEKTSLPVGGKNTHSVLAGHSGLARTKIFDDIDKLKIGDRFYIHVLDEILIYQVDKIDVVKPDDTDTIKVEEDKDYVTLVTCTPRKKNTHRLLVRGTREEKINEINSIEQSIQSKQEPTIQELKTENKNKIYISIVVAILALILFLFIFFWDEIKKR